MNRTLVCALVLGLVVVGLPATAGEDFFKALGLQQLSPPRPAPDFSLSDLTGKTVSLGDFRGKIVFLNFWTTWCPACRDEMPSMERLWQEFGSTELVMLAVDMEESRGTVERFVQEHQLTFPALLDSDGKVSARYGVRFIPTTVLIDRDGRMIARVVGPKDWSSRLARRLLASLLEVRLAAATDGDSSNGSAVPPEKQAIRAFLAGHWARPLRAQGSPPRRFTPIEASLAPKDCGICHPAQFADWQPSAHAKAMSPGVMGQLVDMDASGVELCQSCHAPLAEQHARMEPADTPGRFISNPRFSRALRKQGLTCAACHVRGWERFGPPKRDGALVSTTSRERLPHNGATRTPAFLRSEFCKSCHQFEPDGFALNGKLLENTYEEWRGSPYAARGIQCQNCHMPDRRHLWRGIHSSEMVESGITVDLKLSKPRYRLGEQVEASLSVTNSGVGHYFPTYLTPKVFLRMDLVDATGRPIPKSGEEAVIGREATLNLSQELYDTRLPPTASFTMKYGRTIERPGLRLRARVVVEPDHFYTKFFEAVIPGADRGKGQLQEALAATRQSAFTVFSEEVRLQ